MKPFDLEAAKRGEKVVDRDGNEVKFLLHVPEATERHRVVAMHGDVVTTHGESGTYIGDDPEDEDSWDLFIEPTTRWVNIYPQNGTHRVYQCSIWNTEAEADAIGIGERLGGKAHRIEV
jgi:hypothetical protein